MATLWQGTRCSACSLGEGTQGTRACYWGNEAPSLTPLLYTGRKGQNKQWQSAPNPAETSETIFQSRTPALWDPNWQGWLSPSLSPPVLFHSQIGQSSRWALQKEDILKHEIWNIGRYLRGRLVLWFSKLLEEPQDISKEPQDLSSAPRLTVPTSYPHPPNTHTGKERKERGSMTPCPPTPSIAAPLLWFVFLFILKILTRSF